MNVDNITPNITRVLQTILNNEYGKKLIVDGDLGPNTIAAIVSIDDVVMLQAQYNDRTNERAIVIFLQLSCVNHGIDVGEIDGFYGPQTDYAAAKLIHLIDTGKPEPAWRDDEGIGASEPWPNQTQQALEEYYGKVGENMTSVISPYPLKIAWNPTRTITKFTCHKKVKDSIERVLQRTLDHYGLPEIQRLGLDMWGGCFNVRKMRGGSKWSTHSWGISIDWDPARNRLRWNKEKAQLSKPAYDAWWLFWEDEGWTSLGRNRDYDWMHVQAANVNKHQIDT